MGYSNHRDWPRKRCWPTNLGSGELPTVPNPNTRWIHCTNHLRYFRAQSRHSRLWFVNNVDLCIMGLQQQGTTVIPCMQESLNTWAGLLCATGGALVPDKCFWYNIHNRWESSRRRTYFGGMQRPISVGPVTK